MGVVLRWQTGSTLSLHDKHTDQVVIQRGCMLAGRQHMDSVDCVAMCTLSDVCMDTDLPPMEELASWWQDTARLQPQGS